MEALSFSFTSLLQRLGITLPCDFSSLPHCIHFSIGGEEEIYLGDHRKPNGAYIENALDRTLKICKSLLPFPLILRIDGDREEILSLLPRLHLPGPSEICSEGGFDSLYWDLTGSSEDLRHLFREIIRSELSAEGLECLCSSVYLVHPGKGLLFHLYDDRGAYLSAADPAFLRAAAEKFPGWILEK